MSAGYIIYSLDWDKFRNLVERPTQRQLAALGKLLRDRLDEHDGEFEKGDPISDWPTDVKSLARIAAQRLVLPDWYGDLSAAGKNLWEGVVFNACMNCDQIDVGFRVDNDGIYWDVIEIVWKHLGVVPKTITKVALSTFGTRPYRYHQSPKPTMSREDYNRGESHRQAALTALEEAIDQYKARPKKPDKKPKTRQKDKPAMEAFQDMFRKLQDPKWLSRKLDEELTDLTSTPAFAAFEKIAEECPEDDDDSEEWSSMHSMHTPDEVQKMRAELKSTKRALKTAKNDEAWQQYEDDLMPAIETVAREGRMLFIQVDT